jgi:hypothetical protein
LIRKESSNIQALRILSSGCMRSLSPDLTDPILPAAVVTAHVRTARVRAPVHVPVHVPEVAGQAAPPRIFTKIQEYLQKPGF